jgi:hypothetical protein
MFRYLICLFSVLFFSSSAFSLDKPLTPLAQQIYNDYHKSVVQVRVIHKGSGEKSSLGSGFYFTEDGLIATNFHVVSGAVNYPSLFSVEYIMADGTRGPLQVVNIDPVHDLAIVRPDRNNETYLRLGNSQLQKGDKIFSFGNPYDLGLIIIEGLYNGLVENARFRKILLSGALNPGMSGGPAVGGDGTVLGVNVATSGNDISFVVPVEFLKELVADMEKNGAAEKPSWEKIIRQRIEQDQDDFLQMILKKEKWDKRRIGRVEVPGEVSGSIRCWGESGDNKKNWVTDHYLRCSVSDGIFVSDTLRTGMLFFGYEWYSSRGHDMTRFYNIFEKYAANRDFYFENAYQRDAGNFKCDHFFSKIAGNNAKVEFCTRPYTNYPGLFDFSTQVTSTHLLSEGLVVNIYGMGFTEAQTKSFLGRFLREIEWKE